MLLEESDYNQPSVVHPILNVAVGKHQFCAVLDSGSPISVISEDAFEKCMEIYNCPVLPMQKIKLKGAISGKGVEVKRQTCIEFNCQGVRFCMNFVIVSLLSTELILGVDFMNKYNAIMNFNDGDICVMIDNEMKNLRFNDVICKQEEMVNRICFLTQNMSCTWPTLPDNNTFERRTPCGIELESDINDIISKKVENVEIGSDSDKRKLADILFSHSSVFSRHTGTIRGFQYRFRVKEHDKFSVKPYPIAAHYRAQVKEEIQKMLRDGIIEEAVSSYNSPLHVVPKKDGSIRLVLDSRQINTIILPETDRPLTLEELLQNFEGTSVLSSVDLRTSFWQVELHTSCRQYTAFLCFGVCYQFRKLPFGLNISSSAFIRALNSILPEDLKNRITSYVDDILIAEKSWTEHNYTLNRLLQIFKENGITVNLEKSEFGKSKIKFLGHIISSVGIEPDPEKLEAIRSFPTPVNKRQVRGFLGLVNFYRRFLKLQELATPKLCALTGKNTTWNWDTQAQCEFLMLKEALINAPILCHPDLSRDFCLSTDSSKIGVAGHLFQEYEENGKIIQRSIAFTSRVLTKSEKNYGITELECLALIHSFSKFRFFLQGKHTKVYTDHRALEFLMSAKLTNDRLRRWALFLQEFHFTVIYIPGSKNIVADALSRAPIGMVQSPTENHVTQNFSILYMTKVAFENFISTSLQNIAKEQDKDPTWKDIKQKWSDKSNSAIRQFYLVRDNVLFKRCAIDNSLWVVCIPDELVNKLIWYIHLSYAHYGARKCFYKLRTTCYFNNMERRIRLVLAKCKLCQKAKPPTVSHQAPLFPIIPCKLRDLAAVDLLGPLVTSVNGFSYIFVAVELTSKFVSLTPLRKATARTVCAAFVKHFLKEVGHVNKVISDNGPQFRSRIWTRILRRYKAKPIFISRYWPASNPSERIMKELNKLCRIYCYRQHRSWDKYIHIFQNILNELPHDSTSLPPVLVLKNKSPADKVKELINFPATKKLRHRDVINIALTNIKRAADQRKRLHPVKINKKNFYVGQKVLIKSHRLSQKNKHLSGKFFLLYNGPFRIRRIAHDNAVEIETLRSRKSKGLHHISHVKPYLE